MELQSQMANSCSEFNSVEGVKYCCLEMGFVLSQ